MNHIPVVIFWMAGIIFVTPVWGQTPPLNPQGGTYNTPAGAGASTPFSPRGMRITPSSPALSPRIPNRSSQQWLKDLQLQNREKVKPGPSREPAASESRIAVKLPVADAQLSVNNHPTKQTGQDRVFITPDLKPGRYRYRFEASWMADKVPVRRTRTIVFAPGNDLTVDFTQSPESKP